MSISIKNISIRNKLLTLTLLPLIGFVCFAGHDFIRTFNEQTLLKEMLVLTNAASAGSLLVHNLQNERGVSAIYFSSEGKEFQKEVKFYRQKTDLAIQKIQKFTKSTHMNPHLTSIFLQVEQQLIKLADIRQKIDNLTIGTKEGISFYSQLNILLFSIDDTVANDSTNAKLTRSAMTVSSLLHLKEGAALERAVLSNVFTRNKFTLILLEEFIRKLALQENYLAVFNAHATPKQLSIYKNNIKDSSLKAVQAYRDLALDKANTGNFNAKVTTWYTTASDRIDQFKKIEELLLEEFHTTSETLLSQKHSALVVLATLIIISLSLVLLLTFYITKQLQNDINEITNKLINITNNNDLTLRVKVTSEDELGDIGNTINKLVEHLQRLVGKIQNSSSVLKTNMTINKESNRVIKGKIGNGTDQVNQVVTATTEMTGTVTEIAHNAMEASTETEKANEQGQHGNNDVVQAVESISHLSTKLTNASSIVQKLNESALNIGNFLDAVKKISDQTNLLALNAAIEAARAGESGRGFAVVADEVRGLSMQTKKSTDEIEIMVKDLQSDASAAQLAMKSGIEQVDKSVLDITKAGKDISEITNSIQHINGLNQQVATAAEEQSFVTEEINRNMVHIQAGYTEMTTSYQKLEECCLHIDSLATELDQTVMVFKI